MKEKKKKQYICYKYSTESLNVIYLENLKTNQSGNIYKERYTKVRTFALHGNVLYCIRNE